MNVNLYKKNLLFAIFFSSLLSPHLVFSFDCNGPRSCGSYTDDKNNDENKTKTPPSSDNINEATSTKSKNQCIIDLLNQLIANMQILKDTNLEEKDVKESLTTWNFFNSNWSSPSREISFKKEDENYKLSGSVIIKISFSQGESDEDNLWKCTFDPSESNIKIKITTKK